MVQFLVVLASLHTGAGTTARAVEIGFSSMPPQVQQLSNAWFATVKINRIYGSSGARSMGFGSGSIIGTAKKQHHVLVLTAAHVVHCEQTLCSYRIGFTKADNSSELTESIDVRVLAHDEKSDLALLEVNAPKDAMIQILPLMNVGAKQLEKDEPLFAIGFPKLDARSKAEWQGLEPDKVFQGVRWISKGRVRNQMDNYGLRYFLDKSKTFDVSAVLQDVDLLKGNSGGPLVNSAGVQVGVNVQLVKPMGQFSEAAYCAAMTGNCYNVSVSYLQVNKFLSDARVKIN